MNMQHYINHISLIVDASSSMGGKDVVGVFDSENNNPFLKLKDSPQKIA